MGEKETGIRTIIGGDFKAKTRREKKGITNIEKKRMKESGRQSRDRKVNRESRILMDFIEERE